MIEFEAPKPIQMINTALETVAVNMMRPKSRYFDEHEHEIPWDYINFMHMAMRQTGAGALAPADEKKKVDAEGKERPPIGYQQLAFMLERLSWGDVGMYLVTPGGGLGRSGSGSRWHAGAKGEVPGAVSRRKADLWRDGDDRTVALARIRRPFAPRLCWIRGQTSGC